MIASGEKKEEYREIKPFWMIRLLHCWLSTAPLDVMFNHLRFKTFDIVSANNGYAKDCPNIKWKHEGIRIGEGKPEWGAEPGKQYFILQIGELF